MKTCSGSEKVRSVVRREYGRIARTGRSCCGPIGGCSTEAGRAAGYGARELREIPEEANLGLSCGHPTSLASLQPGETVLDLGCGGGLDVFLAARQVGRRGRAIGVDMTPEMIERARKNAERFARRTGLRNVEFRLGEIEHLPVADASVDVVISNCVLNLSPDKAQVWKEIARVLKPGGRVAISDLALRKPLPPLLRRSVEALVGCIAGAATPRAIRTMMRNAGLTGIRLIPRPGFGEWLARQYTGRKRQVLRESVVSLDIQGYKPNVLTTGENRCGTN